MRNAILCVIITTALQRLSIHVFFIAQLRMGRSIFANSKIPENLFHTVCSSLNSFVSSERLRCGGGGGGYPLKKTFVNSPPYFSEVWNFSPFQQVLPGTMVLPASFIKNSNAAAWIYPLGFYIKCRVLHPGLAYICVALLMSLGTPAAVPHSRHLNWLTRLLLFYFPPALKAAPWKIYCTLEGWGTLWML